MENETKTTSNNDKPWQFKPGNAGRPAGPNKLTKTVKETVLAVFNQLQEDPENSLLKFAQKHPRDFYQIAAKLIPQEISGQIAVTKTEIKLIFPEPRGTTLNNNSTANVGGN